MGHKSTKELLKNIIESLKESSKSITELSKDINADRIAVSKYLTLLKNTNILGEEKKGKEKIFYIKTQNKETYFGLPLDKETNKLIDSLYFFIKKYYPKKIFRTTAQKIVYEMAEREKLNIPRGWYKYGGVIIKPYIKEKNYELDKNYKYLQKKVIPIIEEYSKYNKAYESKKHQYEKAPEIYIIKEEISKILYSESFTKEAMYKIQKLYSKMLTKVNIENVFITDYAEVLIDITINYKKIKDLKRKLIESFEALWSLIALYNFKKDLEKYYSKNLLEEHFKEKIKSSEEKLLEKTTIITESIPKINENTIKEIKKIKEKIKLK